MNFNCNHVGSTGGKTIVCLWQGQRRQLAYICHLRHLFEYTIKTNYYFRIAARGCDPPHARRHYVTARVPCL